MPLRRRAASVGTALVMLGVLQLGGCGSVEDRAQSYYESGMKFLAAHDNEKAALEFRNALRLKGDLLPAWRGLAQAEQATHHWAKLVPLLRTILRLDPTDGQTRLRLGRLLVAGGAVDQALKLVNESTESDANDSDFLALKAVIFAGLRDNVAAVREAQAALKIKPDNVDALKVLATDRLANNDPKRALQLLSNDSSALQADVGIQLIKIKIYEQLGDLSQVESLFRKLTELHPQEVLFRKQLIRFYLDQHRPGDAENELRTIIASDPKDSEAELDLVRLLYATKGADAARAELLARISAGGDVFRYQMALADFDYGRGNDVEAYKLLQVLIREEASLEHRLAAKMKLAELNFGRKNFDVADAFVAEILHDDSLVGLRLRASALKLRASILLERGQAAAAVSDLLEALNLQPRSVDLMLVLGTAYERTGAIERAEKQFADAFRVSNSDPTVGFSYAAFLRRRGNTKRAEDILAGLASRQPQNVAVLSTLAEMKLSQGDWAGAQRIGEAIRHLNVSNAIADQILGEALNGKGEFDASIAALQSAVAAEPSALQPMVALVQTLVRAKATDKAVAFLQGVLKSNPKNAQAYVLLGSIQLANNAPDRAMKYFTAAIEKRPNDSVGYHALADLYLSQKNADAALTVLLAGLKQQPNSLTLHMALAGVLEQLAQYDAAIAEYEFVLTQQPGSMIAANNLAGLLVDQRTDKTSLERAQLLAASLRQSRVPQFKDTLGWVTYRTGDFKAALPLLEEAAIALPDQPLVHYHLGMSYAATGQDAKAVGELKTALNDGPSSKLKETIAAELTKLSTQ